MDSYGAPGLDNESEQFIVAQAASRVVHSQNLQFKILRILCWCCRRASANQLAAACRVSPRRLESALRSLKAKELVGNCSVPLPESSRTAPLASWNVGCPPDGVFSFCPRIERLELDKSFDCDLHMANGLEVLFIGFFVSVTAPTWVLLVGFTVSAPISAACQQVVEEASDDQE